MILTTVYFDRDNGVSALYIDGKLEKYGDYYHDKIDNWIEGFIAGCKYIKKEEIIEEEFEVTDEKILKNISEYGDPPPKILSKIKK